MIYPVRPGIDYGRRRGTRGLEFHMTEGNGGYGDVAYLMRHAGETVAEWHARIRGVSAHVVIINDGTIYQMVDFDHVSGNLNPADRAAEYGYYGHSTLVDVLGDPEWKDPNQWSLSAELAGKRAAGPTDAQVKSALAWGHDMIDRYPTLRGAYGHHDQSPKPCPGLSANMKAIFAGLGGHGLWEGDMAEVVIEFAAPIGFTTNDTVNGAASWAADPPHALLQRVKGALKVDATVYIATGTPHGHFVRVITGPGGRRIVAAKDVTPAPVPAADCAQAVADGKAAEHELVRAAAIKAAEAL